MPRHAAVETTETALELPVVFNTTQEFGIDPNAPTVYIPTDHFEIDDPYVPELAIKVPVVIEGDTPVYIVDNADDQPQGVSYVWRHKIVNLAFATLIILGILFLMGAGTAWIFVSLNQLIP